MAKSLKSAGHHWWPEALSKSWADEAGMAHCVTCDGILIPSQPKSFGVVTNANRIVFDGGSPFWNSSFEHTFDRADSAFPSIISWLETLTSPVQASDAPMCERITPFIMENDQKDLLSECLASLISRSPNFRNRIRLTTEYYRGRFGLVDPAADKNLIAANVSRTQEVFSEAIRAGGKFAVLLSGESEFIYGDGFLHSFSTADRPHSPRCLIPLTPNIAILYTRPNRYRSYPQAFVVNLKPEEVASVNWTVQVYSKRFIFFREIYPVIDDAFRRGEHLEVEYHKHPWVEGLQEAIGNTFFGNDRQFHPMGL
ncbi:DUF4238 domain-containing protein [Caulobacter sp. Root655]|uniref:DUF4238 domain-containing protein n=1 Tax=Caulobacter sp. Root655 TaxID=1736578 RepID=UPI0009E8EEB6|nr:DUF4238 domain-containing protein [Caulobacter sp. Root655]